MQNEKTRPISKWIVAACAAPILLFAGFYAFGAYMRSKGEQALTELARERLDCDVQWKRVHLSLFPPVTIVADDLVFRQRSHPGGPPLITVKRLTAEAGLIGVLRNPEHLRSLNFTGLVIQVPPHPHGGDSQNAKRRKPLVVDHITADNTLLRIFPNNPDKDPLTFDIYRLKLDSVAGDRPMQYHATLRNATPPGLIVSEGTFGPLDADDVGASPVSAKYTFDRADLSVFGGIRGMLSSQGRFSGTLANITVDGVTDVPDFTLRISGHPIHLKTEFHAIVDGVNGDVVLERVKADFRRTTILAHGTIAGTPKKHGKTLTLNATVENGRVEDMLWLSLKQKQPTLRGAASLRATIEVPPGPPDLVDKLRIQATAGIDRAKLKPKLQQGTAKISDAARGNPVDQDPDPDRLASDFRGAFWVAGGVAHFRSLSFHIPGADVVVSGTYGLKSEAVDLSGRARLDAKLSHTSTGFKSILLKPFDGLFKSHHKNKETSLPIHIGGTLDHPDYGPDFGKILTGKT